MILRSRSSPPAGCRTKSTVQGAGFNDPEWDRQFVDLIVDDPETLARMSQSELAKRGGWEEFRGRDGLIMRGALAARPKVLSRDYYLPSMTGIATLLLENRSGTGMLRPASELDGATLELPQSQPFTLGLSVKRYDLNRFLQQMVVPEHRAAFLADEAELSPARGSIPLIRR